MSRRTPHADSPVLPPRAFSYQRFSKPEQARGDSLRRQAELAAAWSVRHGVPLDDTLRMRDMGVSGYSGANRSDKAALGVFLELVRAGSIPVGSYLLVESLDRLSREEAVPALSLLLELLQAGVRVVQLLPAEVEYDAKANPMALMLAIAELSRGHSESAMKSERCGRAWRAKKAQVAIDRIPPSKMCPAWIEVIGDGPNRRAVLRPREAEAVRLLFRLSRDGFGIDQILRIFRERGVAPIGRRARHWSPSYANQILKSRAALGEYVPMRGKARRDRVPDGDPVPGVFPAVVCEEEWLAVQAGLAQRRHFPGRDASSSTNIWKGLVRDALTGTPMLARAGGPSPVLFPSAYSTGGAPFNSYPLAAFDSGLLSLLREVDPRDVMPRPVGSDPVAAVVAERTRLAARITELQEELVAGGEVRSLAAALRRLESELAAADARLVEVRRAGAGELAGAWDEARGLLGALETAQDPHAARVRLRSAIRRVVERIWVVVVPRGDVRLCAAQVCFTGGVRRDYLLAARRPRSIFGRPTRQAAWLARSLTGTEAQAGLNLRETQSAAECEASLLLIDVERLDFASASAGSER
ncbi:MAG: recombinase family protein [Fimbriiglobus sp.]|nr:recombinase family protein [Fimbriiglobus sp.]